MPEIVNGTPPRRCTSKRTAWAIAGLIVCLVVGGGYLYFRRLSEDIHQATAFFISLATHDKLPGVNIGDRKHAMALHAHMEFDTFKRDPLYRLYSRYVDMVPIRMDVDSEPGHVYTFIIAKDTPLADWALMDAWLADTVGNRIHPLIDPDSPVRLPHDLVAAAPAKADITVDNKRR